MAKIDPLLKELMAQNGSDLHLEQGQKPKIRLNGDLTELSGYSVLTQEYLCEIFKEIAGPDPWHKFEHTGDVDFAYAMGEDARFRANLFRHFLGYGGIFRLIPCKIRTLEELNMPDTLKRFALLRSGLVLVTGPTGSGKSSTLAAIIDHINNTQTKKIVTIEEPVEFMHTNKKSIVVHREAGLDTASFVRGLRSVLKSNVDIVLVGEMRDRETIELALTAAEMGILVFGTLHTNSAIKTIDRIIDVFPTNKKNQMRAILGITLKGVVAQQLLRGIDGNRRWVAYELLLPSPALGTIIRSGETIRLISEMQLNRKMGMMLMDDCLIQLFQSGKITKEEACMKALDKTKFS